MRNEKINTENLLDIECFMKTNRICTITIGQRIYQTTDFTEGLKFYKVFKEGEPLKIKLSKYSGISIPTVLFVGQNFSKQ